MDKIPQRANQDLRLYHGTTELAATDIVKSVDIARGRSSCYDVAPGEASSMVEAARARLIKLDSYEGDADLIYHADPADVAGDMMHRDMAVRRLFPDA